MAKRKRTTKTMKRYAGTRGPRELVKQAASDVERGLEDTEGRAGEKRWPRSRTKA